MLREVRFGKKMGSGTKEYIPNKGDIVWLNFTPQSGREQAGHRPALVLSPKTYNQKTGLALCCPITSKVKGYPFEVFVSKVARVKGVILADHIKNLDWRIRQARYISRLPKTALAQVTDKILALLQE